LIFGCSKAFEYTAKLRAGLTMLSNDFYMYYYALTGIHLLHVVAGMGVLAVLWHKARDSSIGLSMLECGVSYWHMVDVLWILLFPLLYLVR
jgi:nitric oxide reductase NorE protein